MARRIKVCTCEPVVLRRSMLHNAASDPARMMVCTAGCCDLGTEQVWFTGEEISGVYEVPQQQSRGAQGVGRDLGQGVGGEWVHHCEKAPCEGIRTGTNDTPSPIHSVERGGILQGNFENGELRLENCRRVKLPANKVAREQSHQDAHESSVRSITNLNLTNV